MPPEQQPHSSGPTVGIIIIVLLLIFGALYFWGAHLNSEGNARNTVPYIPPGPPIQATTSSSTAQ